MRSIYFLLIFSMLGCTDVFENKNNVEKTLVKKVELVKSGEKKFSPDENTPVSWQNTAVIDTPDTIFFYLYNSYNSELNIFNYNNSKFTGKKTLKKQADGISVVNRDTLYLYNYFEHILYEMNFEGKLRNTYSFSNVKGDFLPDEIGLSNGVFPFCQNVYMTCHSVGESTKTRFTCIKYNTQTRNKEYIVEYPAVYQKANWGGGMYRRVFSCCDQKQGNIIFSFPASHDILVYHESNGTQACYYAGSQYIQSIKAFSNDKSVNLSNEENINYFLDNNSYANIVYDKWRNVYYRVAQLPVKNRLKNNYSKEISIIILNADFQKIGETLFSSKYGNTLLVSPDGLLLPYISEKSLSDDKMVYHVFKVIGEGYE